MKGSYCYMPILKTRGGHFNAVRTLSPTARALLAPLFDIGPPNLTQAKNPKAYLEKKIHGIVGCWAPDRPVYIDAHDFPLDTFLHSCRRATPAKFDARFALRWRRGFGSRRWRAIRPHWLSATLGVINSRYVKPGRPVNVEGEFSGPAFSAGDQRMSLAAQGLASPGNLLQNRQADKVLEKLT